VSPRDLLGFALAALSRHRLRTALSLLGVGIGVAAVVVLTALGEGARRFVIGQFSAIGSNLVIVVPGRNETTGGFPGMGGVPNDLTLDDARALERGLRELELLAPIAMANETVAYRERRRQVPIMGSSAAFREVRQLRVASGGFLPERDYERGGQEVVLGAKLARELFGAELAVGNAVRIGEWRMRVIGVLAPTGMQVGVDVDEIAVIPVATAMRMFDRSSLFRIVARMRSHLAALGACQPIVSILRERHGEEDVTCMTQASVVSTLSTILGVLTLALAGIAAISLAVAGIGIMNLMLVSVSERTAEVGLMRAVGARGRQIVAVFLAEALLTALLGGVLGLTFGWGVVRALGWTYPAFPAAVPAWAAAAALGNAIAIGALFGILPAYRAARLDPIASLRGRP
jgi:putative ABC transport system permease protein